jgi:monofunctional biosynthetic peptidoglycan transglycosylase
MVVRSSSRLLRRFLRRVLRGLVVLALVAAGIVVLLRWVNPPPTFYMLSEWRRLGGIERDWVDLATLPDRVPLSAMAAEDAGFCGHRGFDIEGIRAALADRDRLRGGSTISQQVAKNVFLWQGRTWLRKGLEAGFAVVIELAWPKRRIMEVYLNHAEFGEGVFGVEAAARHYWGIGAAELGPQRAARLMAVLPAPKARSPVSGSGWIARRGAAIRSGAETLAADGRGACVL